MKAFKVNVFPRQGNLYVRSSYNSKKIIRISSGLSDTDRNKKNLKDAIEKAHTDLRLMEPSRRKDYGQVFDLRMIWKRYLENLGEQRQEDKPKDVLSALERFPVTHSNKAPHFTRKAKKVKMHLENFCKINNIKELTFKDLNRAILQQYEAYLSKPGNDFVYNGKLKEKKPLASGSRKEHFVVLKAASKYALGDTEVNPEIFKYSVTEISKPSRALEWEELKKILNYEPKDKTEDLTKDIFLFSCFTGMRITAIQNIKCSDIAGGFINWINTKTKSQNLVSTTIHRFNAPIITKYKDKGPLFPYIAQQTLNNVIKAICGAVGIEKPDEVHNHTGRHTYNSLLYALGIDTFIRNEEVGHAHSSINEKVYTKIDEQERKTIIVRVFDNLETILSERKAKYTTAFDDV